MISSLREKVSAWRRKPSLLETDFADDGAFLEALYRMLLDRPADQGGKEFHLRRLRAGEVTRNELLRDFINSDECRANRGVKYEDHQALMDFQPVLDPAPLAPYVESPGFSGPQLCELVNPRKWLDQRWYDTLGEMRIYSPRFEDIHRKHYEYVQTAYGLRELGAINDSSAVLGVGAGHEIILYWLANNAGRVVGTDLYDGDWVSDNAREGDPDVLNRPEKYAPFPYRQERLSFRRMDGRRLEFDDASFDVVYSLSSIEHFGGHAGAAQSMAEIGRVLRPGGVAVIATELIISGGPDEEFFTLEALVKHVVAPSGLKLVQMPVFELPRAVLASPLNLPREVYFRPHLLLSERGMAYTSVMLFLRKP